MATKNEDSFTTGLIALAGGLVIVLVLLIIFAPSIGIPITVLLLITALVPPVGVVLWIALLIGAIISPRGCDGKMHYDHIDMKEDSRRSD